MATAMSCHRMTHESLEDAFRLLGGFLRDDEYYIDSSQAYGDNGDAAIRRALQLLLSRPELGFVWLGSLDAVAVAVAVVSLAVSTSVGALIAKLDDVYVEAPYRRRGIGTEHFVLLKSELRRLGVQRIDTSVHLRNEGARRFYQRLGFQSLHEERISLLLAE